LPHAILLNGVIEKVVATKMMLGGVMLTFLEFPYFLYGFYNASLS